MKRIFKKQKSPRLENAIKRACEIAHANSGWWYVFRSNDLGDLIYNIAYKADKFDVLNKLADGVGKSILTFIRGDIRPKKPLILKAATTINITITLTILFTI